MNIEIKSFHASVNFKCEECEYVAKSSTGLKILRKAKI